MATTQALVACLNTLDTNPTQNLDLLFELSRDLAVRQEAARHNAIPKLSTLFNHYYSLRHESSDNTVMLFKILRVMRNLCGNVPETPIAIRDARILEASYQLLDEYTHKSALDEHDYLLLRTIVTLHSNMVVSSAEIKREIWQRAVHSALYWRITALTHTPLNAHIAMCLLNCTANDSELRAQLLQEDQPAMRLYMKLLDLAALETDEHENVNTSVFYWVYLLFQKLVDRFEELMMLARDTMWHKTDQSDDSEPTSTRQVLLLKFLEARVEELNAQPALLDTAHKARMLKYLEQRFEELEAKEMVFTARIKFSDEAQFKRDLEALYLIVRILSHILECASSDEKELLRTAGLLITVIRMFKNSLDHEAELERARKETGVELRREKMAKTRIVEEEFNFKVELMKLVCNMCYRHRASQDEVRELKGLPAILNHCNIDDNNPYIKEWAIVTLRNLCENNAENQEAIASLKTQGILATEELERLGLQAKLEDNGKVTISKK